MKEPYEIAEENMAREALHDFSEQMAAMQITAASKRKKLQDELDQMPLWKKAFSQRPIELEGQIQQLDEELMWEMRSQAVSIAEKIGNQSREGIVSQIQRLRDLAWWESSYYVFELLPSGPERCLDNAIRFLTGDY